MSKVQMLRALVKQRLTAAAEEIFGLFERTIAEYEEELCRSKEENHRQRRLLDAVFNSDDMRQLLVGKDISPEQQKCSRNLDRDDQEPTHIKEELEEDNIKFRLAPVPMKSEDNKEKHQSSQVRLMQMNRGAESQASSSAEHMIREPDGSDSGRPEATRNSGPTIYLQPLPDDMVSDTSEPEALREGWKETEDPQPGLNSMKNNVDHVSVLKYDCEKPFSCTGCSRTFKYQSQLKKHIISHTGEKPFSCSECSVSYRYKMNLTEHMRIHTGEKPFCCSECNKTFRSKIILMRHIRIHTGEKPFSCSVCGESFTQSSTLTYHMRRHTGEKPFSCSVCKKRFRQSGDVAKHMRVHTGERPYTCSFCSKGFAHKTDVIRHMKVHTGEAADNV
ncbi:zinc finger protein 771-like [Thalassophryne amazonica]|uniref:zinc finger protein 771-like n=1 Tax=Thalassophryne amazonica TaxID=390379 RepID=UPI0014718B37|nr:zinc finger protein 771-like [Thalassophryne amazonica]